MIEQIARINRAYEKKYLKPVQHALMPPKLISTIEKDGLAAGAKYLHATIANPYLSKTINDLYLEVGLRHARMNYRRVVSGIPHKKFAPLNSSQINSLKTVSIPIETKQFGFNQQWTNFILNYLREFLITKITFEVSQTTREKLLSVIEQAINEGLGVDETVKRLESLPFLEFQAARIVRTEINRAANVGAKAQAETFPYQQMKEWISAHDNRVRGIDPKDHASHIGLDGVKINEDDLFQDPRNGDLLEFPGDPRANAESTINCRCIVAYTAKRDSNGRLIPKRQTTTVIFPRQNRPRTTVLV